MADRPQPPRIVKGRIGGVRPAAADPAAEPADPAPAPPTRGAHRRVGGPAPSRGVPGRRPIDESTAIPAEDLATGRRSPGDADPPE
jgi:hypothetical protein